jgi:hypothetical protein
MISHESISRGGLGSLGNRICQDIMNLTVTYLSANQWLSSGVANVFVRAASEYSFDLGIKKF